MMFILSGAYTLVMSSAFGMTMWAFFSMFQGKATDAHKRAITFGCAMVLADMFTKWLF